MNRFLKLLVSLAIPQAVAGSAAYFTITGRGTWYEALQKPEWNPPDWAFGPTWTLLYILMGLAFYLVWTSDRDPQLRKRAMVLWGVQLLFNFLWSFLFFRQHLVGVALAEIVLLWILILLTIFAFAKVNRLAAWLLVPYISWVTFAALLNFAIWKLNGPG